jgi:DNA-binding NarL/FixJ family response regulator
MLDSQAIKVLVLYDDPLVRAGLTWTLQANVDMRPLDTRVSDEEPDVIVADYEQGLEHLSRQRGEAAARRRPPPRLLILSRRDSEREIRHALESGARGYLTLGCGLPELVDAVRAVHRGLRHLGAMAACRLADSVASRLLTERETDVLRLLVEGHGNKAIARQLDIALGTVKSHLKAVFQKLDAKSRTEVAAVADKRGLLTPLPRVEPRAVESPASVWQGAAPHDRLAVPATQRSLDSVS